MDDQEELEQLEHELSYRPPRRDHRFFKTNPPGVNVLTAMGAVCGLGTFAALAGLLVSTVGGRQGPGQSVAAVVAIAVAVVVALAVPPIIWRALGPVGRQIMRPMGLLGPLPLIFAFLMGFAAVVQGVKLVGSGVSSGAGAPRDVRGGPEAPESPGAPGSKVPRETEWQVLSVPNGDGGSMFISVRLAEARQRLEELGSGWRLPREEDLPYINANVKGRALQRQQFHFDRGDDSGRSVLWWSEEQGWHVEEYKTANLPWQVLCVRP